MIIIIKKKSKIVVSFSQVKYFCTFCKKSDGCSSTFTLLATCTKAMLRIRRNVWDYTANHPAVQHGGTNNCHKEKQGFKNVCSVRGKVWGPHHFPPVLYSDEESLAAVLLQLTYNECIWMYKETMEIISGFSLLLFQRLKKIHRFSINVL